VLVKRLVIASWKPQSAPSNTAKPSEFRAWHHEKWMLDHRRDGDNESAEAGDNLPPISLQYAGFGQFLDIFYDLGRVPDVDKVSSRGIRMAVDIFAEKMSRVHADEDKRKTAGLSTLNDVLSELMVSLFS
jgi:hypothetical protein